MSRSRKKPIIKDKTEHKWYNRIIRRRVKQVVKHIPYSNDPCNYIIPKLRELVNDYDICDYIFNLTNRDSNDEDYIKYSRK